MDNRKSNQVGHRWETKKLLNLPEATSYTWQAGLHRMMAGFAMEPTDDSLFQGIYPYDEIEQTDHSLLLGKLSQFMHQLFECREQIQGPKTPNEWCQIINQWLADLFIESSSGSSRLNTIPQSINKLDEETEAADFKEAVSYQIVCDYLKNELETHQSRGRKGRGVTFSSVVAKRGIPAKIIGIIGMDDGAFPQSQSTPKFDLVAQKPQKGDRSPAKDSRQLFLECLLAAKDGIYFSYTGQSDRTDDHYPPSPVLQELIDYIAEYHGVNEKEVVQQHPLQPFSRRYFTDNGNLFSFSRRNRDIADEIMGDGVKPSTFLAEPLPDPKDSVHVITLNDFISFFRNPAKYVLQKKLDIYFHNEDIPDENRESFSLSNLEQSSLERKLGHRLLNSRPVEPYYDIAQSKDLLPDGWPGRREYNQKKNQTELMAAFIKNHISNEPLEPIEINTKRDNIHINGYLNNVYPDEQILYRFGKMRPKDLISLWINHLYLQSNKPDNHSGESRLITHGKKAGKAVIYKLDPPIDPGSTLDNLITTYQNGRCGNILFFQHASYRYARAIFKKSKNESDAVKKAQQGWSNPYQPYSSDYYDLYNKCLMQGVNPLDNEQMKRKFKQISASFWEPFFNVLGVSKQPI